MLALLSIVIGEIGLLQLYAKKYSIGLFNILWGCILASLQIERNESTIGNNSLVILLLMILCVNVGFIAAGKRYTIGKNGLNLIKKDIVIAEVKFNEPLFSLIELFSMIIMLYYLLRTFKNNGFNLMLIRSANNSIGEGSAFSGILDTILYYGIAAPLIYVGLFAVVYNIFEKVEFKKKSVILVAVNVVLMMLSSGGRSVLMRGILFVGSAIIWRLHTKEGISRNATKKIIIGGIVAFALLNVITHSRNATKVGFVAQLIDYLQGSIVHFDYQLNKLEYSGPYFGSIIYGGFFYYIIKVINILFGTSLQTSNDILGYLQNYVYLKVNGRTMYYNALVPNAFYYYFDSGIFGVITFSLILGFFGRRGEMNQGPHSFLEFVIWACSFYAFIYSPYGGIFWNFSVATAVLYSLGLKRALYKKAMTP